MIKTISIILILFLFFQVLFINSIDITASSKTSIHCNSLEKSDIDWWTCFHHDSQNMGYSSSETPDEGNLLWTYYTGSSIKTSPAIVDDKVYMSCGEVKKIVCLNASNGNEIWRFYTVGRVYTSPAVDNNRIYIGDDNGIMYCLDSEDGSEIWTYHIVNSQIKSSPTVCNGLLYFGDIQGRIFCLNAKTGRKIWSRISGYRIESCPAVWQGKLYFGGEDRRMHCFGAYTGRFIWTSFQTGFWIYSSPAVDEGRVYAGSYDDRLYVFNAHTGYIIRIIETDSVIKSSPAIWNDFIYVGSYDDNIYCFNDYGWKIWAYKTGGDVSSSPAVGDGKVYVGSYDNFFYCLNATNGNEIWSYETDASISSSPAICNGRIFIGSHDGKLYCFGSLADNQIQVDAGGPYYEYSGNIINFNGILSGGTPPYNWSWDFNEDDGIQSDDNNQKPFFSYNKSGWYNVSVKVTDANGLTSVDVSKAIISNKIDDIILKEINSRGLGLNAIIFNNGSNSSVNIEWSISFYEGIYVYLYFFHTAFFLSGVVSRGVIDEIAPGESVKIKTSKLFGFGLIIGAIDIDGDTKSTRIFLLIGASLFDLDPIINRIIPNKSYN